MGIPLIIIYVVVGAGGLGAAARRIVAELVYRRNYRDYVAVCREVRAEKHADAVLTHAAQVLRPLFASVILRRGALDHVVVTRGERRRG
jgi:hypothetical protein